MALNLEYGLYEREGKPFCTSRQVAETFEKRHNDVLRDIRELDCSEEFRLRNFAQTHITFEMPTGGKRRDPQILMTKDGFMFLVMGYRGKKAAAFKEMYIERFNKMEIFIESLLAARMEHPAFTEAVMLAHDEPKSYHFINESDMINRLVLGVSAKQFRETRKMQKGESIRPYVKEEEISTIEMLQKVDIGLLAVGISYEERKTILRSYLKKWKDRSRGKEIAS
jgi:Rha family phage regulatory protein